MSAMTEWNSLTEASAPNFFRGIGSRFGIIDLKLEHNSENFRRSTFILIYKLASVLSAPLRYYCINQTTFQMVVIIQIQSIMKFAFRYMEERLLVDEYFSFHLKF